MNKNKLKLAQPGQQLRVVVTCVVLLSMIAALTQAQSTSSTPQNMLGRWQGFLSYPPDPIIPVRFEVTSQTNRRINGLIEVGGIDPEPFMFNGTVAASDRVNLQGQHEDRHGVAKLNLHDFGAGAAVLNGSLSVLAAGGQVSDGPLLLLRPFTFPPDPIVPNPAGSYVGSFFDAEGTRGAGINATLFPPEPVQPTKFSGEVIIIAGEQRWTFQLLGTMNSAGRLIAIAQGSAGHVIFDATWAPVPDDGRLPMITGRHILELNDGTVHEGTFSMTPEPAR